MMQNQNHHVVIPLTHCAIVTFRLLIKLIGNQMLKMFEQKMRLDHQIYMRKDPENILAVQCKCKLNTIIIEQFEKPIVNLN